MLLVVSVIGAAVIAGFATGGSLAPFQRLPVHWWGVALTGLALQGVPPTIVGGRHLAPLLLLSSYTLLLVFAWLNRRLPAMLIVMAGLAMNVLVIAADGGMPVSAAAMEAAGTSPGGLADDGPSKHHLMGPGDVLTPFADVIGIPEPVGAVLSVGDLLVYVGLAALVVSVMRGRSVEDRRPPPRWFQGYRGKHLPMERRFAHRGGPAAPVAGDPWGT